jgi:hypothetical protein
MLPPFKVVRSNIFNGENRNIAKYTKIPAIRKTANKKYFGEAKRPFLLSKNKK